MRVVADMTEEDPLAEPQRATARLRLGDRLRVNAGLAMTPLGLLATGGLVAAILLSVPPIIRAARKPRG